MESLCLSCRALALNIPRNGLVTRRIQPAIRAFSTTGSYRAVDNKKKAADAKRKLKQKETRKKKKFATYKLPDLKDINKYSLVDAMQYIKAFEVGRNPSQVKFDVAIRLRTKKDGPVLRNQIKLPYAVKTDIKVCVLVPAESKQGKAAKAAGASLVGEEEVFDIIKDGKIDFDRCITTPEMLPKIQKAGLPRVLGPRGLMPSVKLGTVTDNIAASVKAMMGGSTYRERRGVVRMAVGQLGFTPEQLRDNVQALIAQLRKESNALLESSGFNKEIFDVVLSSTNAPAFSLSGDFRGNNSQLPKWDKLPILENLPERTKVGGILYRTYRQWAKHKAAARGEPIQHVPPPGPDQLNKAKRWLQRRIQAKTSTTGQAQQVLTPQLNMA
ncbi:hypothetical protein LTS08_004734 [Lithohypha guttulata]|uniref:Ribosomal protein L1 n=1 Tax=Lithohypha guttulata TaxID=1690604 RepID=A0AAN7T269_9EURO|nr:hypothetical protein LTR05_002424 [Lithohypha guttulata]KAK5101128.1 hypothetical protein LTS08_004734 [Lithohypha guttulata]